MALIGKGMARDLRYRALCLGAHCGIALTALLPRKIGLLLFGAIGAFIYCIPHPDRALTLRHLKLIYGNSWADNKIRATARSVYRNLGKNLFDAFYLPRLTSERLERLVTHDPLDAFRSVYDQGRGVIAITAHTGCFEMLLQIFPRYGFKCFAIGRKLHDERLDRIIRSARSGDDNIYMDRSEPPRKIVRHLKEGRVFGVLVDQDTAVEGVFADFLGRPAYTPSGPVKLAMKMNIPVFVVTTARQKGDMHHIFINGPLNLRTGNEFEEDLIHNCTAVNRLICTTIDRFPDQWVWMHNRWHRQPPGKPVAPEAAVS